MKIKVSFLFFMGILPLFMLKSQVPVSLNSESIHEIVKAMTIDQKVRMVLGTKMSNLPNAGAEIGMYDSIVPGSAGATFSIKELGVSAMVLADGPAGVRISPERNGIDKTYYCTTFPGAMSLASSWNKNLVFEIGRTMGVEAKEYGIDILLTPALNIQRTPLCGRNFEYYSEDPYVSGKIAAAMINGIQTQGVGTSIKHFAVNNQEISRRTINVNISESALRNIYLKGFEIAIKESSPWTVMTSYNKINGVYTSENSELIEGVLRKEWGYKGMVMTDWNGGKSAVQQMIAGNDLLMPGRYDQFVELKHAVQNEHLAEKVLDRNVERILKTAVRSNRYKKYNYSDAPDLKKHAIVSREAAAEGMVLLKNTDNFLPLHQSTKVALFGNTSYQLYKGGIGSGDVNSAYNVSLFEGLTNSGFTVSEVLLSKYNSFLDEIKNEYSVNKFKPITPVKEMSLSDEEIYNLALEHEVALFTIGRYSGEFSDIPVTYFYLTKSENDLLNRISRIFHSLNKKIIVVLNTGSIVDVVTWRDSVDAIIAAWYSGSEGGNAIADLISGRVNPSGKLTVTIPFSYEDLPSAPHYPGYPASNPTEVDYCEDVYVGYRYFSTFNVKTAYEFGYGLSYTSFKYSNLRLEKGRNQDTIQITFKIENVGNISGKEVAQLYVEAPSAGKLKPVYELKGFAKTKLLQSGESQTISVNVHISDLRYFDSEEKAWIVERGTYKVKVGASVSDIKLKSEFNLKKDLLIMKTKSVLGARKKLSVLKPECTCDYK